MLTPHVETLLADCLATDNLLPFYKRPEWTRLRREVLRLDHHECQHCAQHGSHTRATHVHHVRQVKSKPDLALSIWYEDNEGNQRRNLISLCHACHELAHDHRHPTPPRPPLTPERW